MRQSIEPWRIAGGWVAEDDIHERVLEDREKEGLVVQQIEKDHELSCHEIIRQHDTIIADLKRDNELLREENTMLR